MSWIKSYTDYVKDNPQGYWFKAKLYGWGWTPATWQGWIAVLMFVLFLLWNARLLTNTVEPTNEELLTFFARLLVGLILLLVITYKTSEKPHWHWGLPKDKNERQS